jgi:dCMP deaminase
MGWLFAFVLKRVGPSRTLDTIKHSAYGTKNPSVLLGNNVNSHSVNTETKNPTIRPSFEEIYMDLAHTLAERSTCARLNVGTVITSTDYRKVLAVGYNGNAAGLANKCDRTDAGNCGCLHSEENAVINCDSPRTMDKYVFVTHLPCVACAKRLINLGGVKKIFYRTQYRSMESIEILQSVGIETVQLPERAKTETTLPASPN